MLEEKVNQNFEIHQGLPPLNYESKPLAFFEFWPGFFIYAPVFFQWLFLSVRYRSLTLPLISNPSVSLSGMVGESKSELFSKASGKAKSKIAPWVLLTVYGSRDKVLEGAEDIMAKKGLVFPVVAKPDIGCRGAGVRKIRNRMELKEYVDHFPEGAGIILQEFVSYEAEAGIFYIKIPGAKKGHIFSITLKYAPYVTGNGQDTLKQLIKKDKRASRLVDLYFKKKKNYERLEDIIPSGEPVCLAFSGSHCRGSIFRDGRDYITPELSQTMECIFSDLPEFYYGRIDIRFKDMESLMVGKNFHILEINGASSEAAHIWDSRSSLKELYRILFYQYKTLFKIGALNRKRGFKEPSLIDMYKAWRRERSLVSRYPDTE